MASLWFPTLSSHTNLFSISKNANSLHIRYQWLLNHRARRQKPLTHCASSAVGGGFSTEGLGSQSRTRETGNQNWDSSQYEDILKGGEQVVSVLDEMARLVSNLLTLFHSLIYSIHLSCVACCFLSSIKNGEIFKLNLRFLLFWR